MCAAAGRPNRPHTLTPTPSPWGRAASREELVVHAKNEPTHEVSLSLEP